ncbi:Importin-beta N-terminal domain [Arabidopsis thaliana x Arabidopsis arenosa]|uniref:Importin-beta N-terminal domain n=1 Tax=Arabidopsis thaliana x Arabidopsis arenosa TaxID=1240361 RepID=A0A8T2AUQ6_9BRAS|nr:Importin-beta N-terminal domain [Arabidopsis thaliana x Arabidopsis arenosa]KAG7576546.1 Importin-beta N-terminal domain [Arabidopsis thaliana x Arabidopsis arenosa]KAG7576547.1 Importin-beta N-terminal domain [Arabidopsis thaliana x Arabidopsis arenosa]
MAFSASDLPAMYTLLANSMSGDETVRRPAEAALSQSESRPGFCSCLMEVIASKDLVSHVDVRLMASVYFKNSINRHWKNRRNSWSMSNEEKSHLRQKLLSHLREENYQIAEMLAVLISKIARFDYPREWPDLFSVLAQQLHSADVLASHRIFLILFRTLKELSTKRLPADQRTFAEISSQFFDFSWHLWQTDVQTILHGFSTMAQSYGSNSAEQHHDELFLTCERWFLCLKIVRQLIISGFHSDAKFIQEIQPVKEVSPALLNAVQSFLPYYSSFQNRDPKFWEFVKKACVKLMKVLGAIQSRHPFSFGDKCVLPVVVDFCLNKITDPEQSLLPFEELFIQCMVMVKSVLECKEYKPSLTGRVMDDNGVTFEQMKKNASNAVGGIVSSLLPNERIVLLCNILVRRYFVLTASDLEEWYQNPESFHHEQDMIQWTEKLRPCAEALYMVLFENYSQLLGPIVVSILQEAMNNCPPSVTEITPALLLKDAAYAATAYVYYELSNYLNFRDWFNGALSLELSNDHPNRRIIHRKVAMILGHWVSEIKDDTKRAVYCSLIKLLQDNDLAVKLAASRSLCLHVEDANFSEQSFLDLLPICWESCFKMVEEVREFDSKVQVLNLISTLIGHVSEVIPYAQKLVQFFQTVWEESSGESLLQIQLLVALRNFVIALGYQSPICYSILLPILQKGIDINSPDSLNLLEDSMALWETTLSYAPMMVPQLLACFPYMVEIIERSFDHLQVAVSIMESYIILDGGEFLNMHASSVAKILDLIVGNVNDKGLLSILPVIDILVQCFPVEVPPLISSCLQKLVIISLSGGDDRDPSKTAVKASSAAILARILVMNTTYLAQLTSDSSLSVLLQQAGVSVEDNILLCLIDIWLDKVDHASPMQKKTFGLALSIILTLRMPQVLDKLDQILSTCTSVILGENKDLTEEESSGDMSSSRSQGEETPPSKELRKSQIKVSDPIYQMSLEKSTRENLQTCSTLHGDAFNSAISRMHPSALAQVKQALKLP